MKNNVVAPSVGESITEVSILKWAKPTGSAVKPGDLLLEIETDKATVEVVAEQAGTLTILRQVGERIPIGEVVATIDDSVAPSASAPAASAGMAPPPLPGAPPAFMPPPMPPIPGAAPRAAPPPPPSGPASMAPPGPPSFAMPPPPVMPHGSPMPPSPDQEITRTALPTLSPSVRRAAASTGVNPANLTGTGKDGRVTKGDVLGATSAAGATSAGAPAYAPPAPTVKAPAVADKPGDRRVPMSMLRLKIAERLVQAQHTAAILTTFNEVDLSAVMKLRSENKDAFKAKHGVNLSFMSFFAKASIAALKMIPEVNGTVDGKDIVYHDYYDLGIAVGTERGLVVPVIRGADQLSFVDFEKKIAEFAVKGRDGKLSMADLTGGTFTISNGGTYGSLMSTPILNPPQSGILGMHKIMDRPIAVNGKVEIRPMMYVALSYDHRIVDGKGAVTWLVALKDHLENPDKLGFSV